MKWLHPGNMKFSENISKILRGPIRGQLLVSIEKQLSQSDQLKFINNDPYGMAF